MVEFKTEMIELYKQGVSITEIAKKICKENSLEYTDSKRTSTSKIINRVKSKGVFDECEAVGIDPDKIKNYWYKGKHYSINVKGETDTFKYEDFKEELDQYYRSIYKYSEIGSEIEMAEQVRDKIREIMHDNGLLME